MFQGQMCWIETRKNVPDGQAKLSGWFQKLKSDECNGTFFYQVGGDVKLNPGVVDDSLLNKRPETPYEVLLVVPTELQAKFCNVNNNLIVDVCVHEVNREIQRIKNERQAKARELEKMNHIQTEVERLAAREDELFQALEEAKSEGMPKFYYAYGKHDAQGKEYCWRIPFVLRDVVKPGVTAIVEAHGTHERCVVTRVEVSPQYLRHKMVIGVEFGNNAA